MKRKWKTSFIPPAILFFTLLCMVVLLIDALSGGAANRTVFVTYHSSMTSPMTYVRFFTHILGHDDWSHLIGNMAYILVLGPMLEEKYGSSKVIQVILITAVTTGLVNYVFFWDVALRGASGVCFAFILLSSFTRFREGEIPLTFILVAVIYLGQQAYEGILLKDNIANMAHIIGSIVGAFVGYTLNKKSKYGLW